MIRRCLALTAAVLAIVSPAPAQVRSSLDYTPELRGPAPLPPAEKALQTAIAEPWFKVDAEGLQLEGAAFDRQGNLHFVDVFGGRVWKVSPDRRRSMLLPRNARGAAGLAIHRDGRLFVAGLGDFTEHGSIVAVGPDGSAMRVVVPESAGHVADDLVFDAKGGFYFTDFKGRSTEPRGGVYYVPPDGGPVTPVLRNLAAANGVALSPDGRTLWVTELSQGRLHRVDLADATTIGRFGTTVPYHFIGSAPDSVRVDADGNVYVAMYGQGRVLVFNPLGIPIGQILVPGRDAGRHLRTTSMAIRPGTRELYILSSDGEGGGGCTIYRATAFAAAPLLFSHR